MSPDGSALDQATAAKAARLRALIRRDIAALRQLVDDSWQLIEEVRRERAARSQARTVGLADPPAAHE
jgi:hypothetical protein